MFITAFIVSSNGQANGLPYTDVSDVCKNIIDMMSDIDCNEISVTVRKLTDDNIGNIAGILKIIRDDETRWSLIDNKAGYITMTTGRLFRTLFEMWVKYIT